MESVKMERECEIHSSQITKDLMQKAIEWIDAIRQYKQGEIEESDLKKQMVEDIIAFGKNIHLKFHMIGESYENTIKDHLDGKIVQIQQQNEIEKESIKQHYELAMAEQEQGIERIAKRYMDLEEQYIRPLIEQFVLSDGIDPNESNEEAEVFNEKIDSLLV